jgi:predicted nuclease with RNAse H fold
LNGWFAPDDDVVGAADRRVSMARFAINGIGGASFVAGIDVSATRGLDVAILRVDGTLVETTWLPDVGALDVWLHVWGSELAVVAIDAPSGVAGQSGGRQVEVELRGRGISLYSAPSSERGAPGWMHTGWRVYRLLGERGFPEVRTTWQSRPCAIECYP